MEIMSCLTNSGGIESKFTLLASVNRKSLQECELFQYYYFLMTYR